jgi:hypothetical protein
LLIPFDPDAGFATGLLKNGFYFDLFLSQEVHSVLPIRGIFVSVRDTYFKDQCPQ